MLVSDVQTRVKREFGDESGAQITDADIIRWINDALYRISRVTKKLEKTATVTVVNGTESYALPTDYQASRRFTVDGSPLRATTLEELDLLDPGREVSPARTGTPIMYYIWDGSIYLYPTPDADATGKLFYLSHPVEVDAAADDLNDVVPKHWHESVVNYCLAKAKRLNEDFEQAAVYLAEFNHAVGEHELETDWPHNHSYPAIQLIAGDE